MTELDNCTIGDMKHEYKLRRKQHWSYTKDNQQSKATMKSYETRCWTTKENPTLGVSECGTNNMPKG